MTEQRANRRQQEAIADMLNGGLLYIYVESKHVPRRFDMRGPEIGSGCIVGDRGRVAVSRRIVRAIQRLGTAWCDLNKAVIMSDRGRAAARGGALWFFNEGASAREVSQATKGVTP